MIRRLSISPCFVADMGPSTIVRVVADPVPRNATIVNRGYDHERDEFYVDLDSPDFTTTDPITPVLRRLDPTNLEDREAMRGLLAEGSG
jgi:hypothetical protein